MNLYLFAVICPPLAMFMIDKFLLSVISFTIIGFGLCISPITIIPFIMAAIVLVYQYRVKLGSFRQSNI